MDELEEYVQAQLPADEAVIQELNDSIKETLHLFSRIEFDPLPKQLGQKEVLPTLWPYWILDNDRKASRDQGSADARPIGRLSQSTTSMIVAAILAATSYPEDRSSSGYRWGRTTSGPPEPRDPALAARLEVAIKSLAQQWKDPKKTEANERGKSSGCALSGTFGQNDIFTISWHLDIFSPEAGYADLTDRLGDEVYAQARRVVLQRIAAYADAPSGYDAVISSFNSNTDRKRIVIDSSYNLLRFIRCIPRVTRGLEDKHDAQSQKITRAKDRAFYRFETRLLAQLSYSSISDSHFDSSELAFCLEGMLQLRPDSISGSLLQRVLEVMEKAQRSALSWSSDMPIIGDHKGQILYPASVEIARSLIASISIFDLHNARTKLDNSTGSRYLMIKRYWTWLKTRRTTITTASFEKVTGWHAEHLNDTAIVHTWETSQILEFCIAFRDQMLRFISRRLLAASRLKVDWPLVESKWSEVASKFEPVTSLGSENEVYAEIGKTLIADHSVRESKKRFWSILLYGPPGTGKSDLAHNIAKVIQVPLLTITVSDFLAEGESGMENRAKLVFDALERQTLSVVLFDELDQFLLDRNSKRFREQDSVFQFLTPGMLTKLQALRKAANVIFVVATNYEERIDPAIKRRGRMDRSFLLLPPDSAQRIRILSRFENTKDKLINLNSTNKAAIVHASAFLGYKDLESVADEPWQGFTDLIHRLDETPRHIQFHSYLDRFEKISDSEKETTLTIFKGPRAELVGLIRLAHESWKNEGSWTDVAKDYVCGREFIDAIVRNLIERRFDKPSKDSLIEELRKQHGITISM